MPAVGADIDHFMLDDLRIEVVGDRCQTVDGTLGGSALNMAAAVRNCVQKAGIPRDEALRMASTYPAEYLGISSTYGFIKPGYRANLVVMDNETVVKAVVSEGTFIEV